MTGLKTEDILDFLPSILFRTDPGGTLVWWNKAADRLLGFAKAGAARESRDLFALPVDWDATKIKVGLEQCCQSVEPTPIDDLRYTRDDGQEGFLGFTLYPIVSEASALETILWYGADITQRKLMHSQLNQAQKLEAIGQLAAGVAHEINTPTQFISDNLHFLKDSFKDQARLLALYQTLLEQTLAGEVEASVKEQIQTVQEEIEIDYLLEEMPEAIKQSIEGTDQIASIVSAMKEFAHPGTDDKTDTDINKIVQNALTVTRNEWKPVATTELNLDPNIPSIPCIQGLLNQVFLNIIINAVHAIEDHIKAGAPSPGKLTIATKRDDNMVSVSLTDTGSGMKEEIRTRIFDPFFTTKGVGKGTGQGLSIAHSIVVDKHHGQISCDSELGKGTTFTIRLPLEHHSVQEEGAEA